MRYHILRKDREIDDLKTIRAIIEKGKYGIIALCKGNEPYVVTLSYGYDKDANALYFHCARKGQKIDYIKANPKACVTIIEDDGFDADSCEHSYRSLVIRGKMVFVEGKKETDYAIRLMIAQLEKRNAERFLARLNNDDKSYVNLQMLKLEIESITGKARQQKGLPTG